MVRPRDRFPSKVVQRAGKPLGNLAAINEENCRVAFADQLKQTWMDRVPDGNAARRLRGGPSGDLLHGLEPRHIFNWNFNAKLQLLGSRGVDGRDWAVPQRL